MGSAFAVLVLVVALALAFDYINGFHDTANAVATVVSTNVLPGRTAVLLAAVCNFVGVGAAKATNGDNADPASVTQLVVAAALLGAIRWNLLTWYFGIPSSSSHALVGGLVGAVWCFRVSRGDPAGGPPGAAHLPRRRPHARSLGPLAPVRFRRRAGSDGRAPLARPPLAPGRGGPRSPTSPCTG